MSQEVPVLLSDAMHERHLFFLPAEKPDYYNCNQKEEKKANVTAISEKLDERDPRRIRTAYVC
jgi:hypothetical protein